MRLRLLLAVLLVLGAGTGCLRDFFYPASKGYPNPGVAAGEDWLVYHALPTADPRLPGGATRRPVLLDRLTWHNGWPVVNDGRGPGTARRAAPFVWPPS